MRSARQGGYHFEIHELMDVEIRSLAVGWEGRREN